MIERVVTEDGEGQRLDKYVRKILANVPLSHLYKMFRTKKVRVNSERGQPERLLHAGDRVLIRGDESQLLGPAPGEAAGGAPRASRPPRQALDILYEDDYLLALNKPSGMAAHPGSGIEDGTVVDLVREYLGPRAVRNDFAASPAHRLDRDTSGVILVAKRRPVMVRFTEIFTAGEAKKSYLALAKGTLSPPKGVIDLPLAEHEQSGRSKALRGINLQEALTRYRVLSKGALASLLECQIETGRTHQIRRHLAAIGHPVAGDRRHGDFPFNRELRGRSGLKRMFLHARRISFEHPKSGEQLTIEAPLPRELQEVLAALGLSAPEST